MKSNIIAAAIVLTMCLCTWGYLAAQSDMPYFGNVTQKTFSPPEGIENSTQQATIPTNQGLLILKNRADQPPTQSNEASMNTAIPLPGGIRANSFGVFEVFAPYNPLLDIKEPSLDDFEHCAKHAVGFLESLSSDQDKMVVAIQELYGTTEVPHHLLNGMTTQLTFMKKEIKNISRPELLAKKSLGGNILILNYQQYTDKWPVFHRFVFERRFDQDGESLKWQCTHFSFHSDTEQAIATL